MKNFLKLFHSNSNSFIDLTFGENYERRRRKVKRERYMKQAKEKERVRKFKNDEMRRQ